MAYPAQLAGSGAAVLSSGTARSHLAGMAANQRRSAAVSIANVASTSPAVLGRLAAATAESNGSVAQ